MSKEIIGYVFQVKRGDRWQYLVKPNGYPITIGTKRGEIGAVAGLHRKYPGKYDYYTVENDNIIAEFNEDATLYHRERLKKYADHMKEYEDIKKQEWLDKNWPKCTECGQRMHQGYCVNCGDKNGV